MEEGDEEGKTEAEDDARNDGEIKAEVTFLDSNIARQSPEPITAKPTP